MKKISLFLAAALLSSASASAQVFVGGSLGYGSKEGLGSTLNISPTIGYAKGENIEFGIHVGYSASSREEINYESESVATIDESEIGLGAFFRYKVFSADKLSLWGQASLDLGIADLVFSTGLHVRPVVKYALTDNFYLTSELNLLNLGFTSTSYDGGGSGTDIEIGVGGPAGLSIGFEYKF
ncbi:hypothetical protein [Candidatus Symbiothrix dinenymphae]|uniref:hypothetical protein n=1 Tax=Candidatus Symbiothrix dinenymphae TaxID=467085 RepID=UPI0006E3C30A|nr:hypothetical protein [Candidatus Symbiothrix dinenymphae]